MPQHFNDADKTQLIHDDGTVSADAAPRAADEDTEARWEPLSDEEWAMTAALPTSGPDTDTAASQAVDEWLEPAATVVRPQRHLDVGAHEQRLGQPAAH